MTRAVGAISGKRRQRKHANVPGSRARAKPAQPGPSVKSFLDRFSLSDLVRWRKASELLDGYFARVYYELALQRKLKKKEIRAALQSVSGISWSVEHWVRIVDHKYTLTPLAAVGSVTGIGGRFNYGAEIDSHLRPFRALYLANNMATAVAEKYGLNRASSDRRLSHEEVALVTPGSTSTMMISGQIDNVFDLTSIKNIDPLVEIFKKFKLPGKLGEIARSIGLTPMSVIIGRKQLKQSLMDVNWRAWPMQQGMPANSQIFGHHVFEAGFEGILYNSAQGRGKCLAVFTERFKNSTSWLELDPPVAKEVAHTRLDRKNWKLLT